MRKPRVVLFDDDQLILDVFRNFFFLRNYEVYAYSEPSICPIYGDGDLCAKPHPCSDLLITDYRMPGMNGIELLEAQTRRGCPLTPQNKAVISGYLQEGTIRHIKRLGAVYFEKPFEFDELGRWVDECELRMDLTKPVAIKRKEERTACSGEIGYRLGDAADIRRGVIVNMSMSGFCMRVREQLPADRSLTFHTTAPRAVSAAIIRWTKETADNAYLVGLQRY